MTGQVPYLQEMKMITSSRGQCTIDLMHNHMNFTHWLDWGGGGGGGVNLRTNLNYLRDQAKIFK